MTRLVKDVLRTGRWKVDHDRRGRPVYWDVDRSTLSEIAQQLRIAQSRGVSMNIGKSHGDRSTGLIPTDELISPIDEAVVEGDTLWISTYVTPKQAKYLQNPARKVSPGVRANWMDGLGNVYPIQMVHVAVTDNPVVAGQGPFLALANRSPQRRKASEMPKPRRRRNRKKLSREERRNALLAYLANDEDDDRDDDAEMDDDDNDLGDMEGDVIEGAGVPHLIELVDEVLEDAYGVHLPEGETGETLVHDLEVITETLGVGNGVDEDEETEEAPELVEDDLPLSLSNRLKQRRAAKAKRAKSRQPQSASNGEQQSKAPAWAVDLANSVKALAGQVKNLSNGQQQNKKAEFDERLKTLGKSGVPSKTLVKLQQRGEREGYDLSLLDVFDGIPGINLNNSFAKRHASSRHAPINAPTSDLSDDDVEEAAALLTGKKPAKNGKK